MQNTRIFTIPFASVYPLYIQKAEKKGRTKSEVDEIIFWLTGYNKKGLQEQLDKMVTEYNAKIEETLEEIRHESQENS